LSIFLFPILGLLGFYIGGWCNWFLPMFMYGILPCLEYFCGVDGYNPSKEESRALEARWSFKLITWVWVPVGLLLVIISSAFASLYWNSLTWLELIGFALSIGMCSGGIGITVAHELIHKQNRFEQFLGIVALFSCSYMHFYIEHLRGHHKRVATEEDPASSRFGETLYAFVPRSIKGSFLSAWHLEKQRLEKHGLPVYSYHNQMLYFISLPILLGCLLGYCFGLPSMVFFFVQSVVAFCLLEIVNYIEHYGLQRKEVGKKGSGRYEQVSPIHSWNADFRATNYFVFKLQRHSDHHTWPTRRYQTLRSWDFSPQFPTGYAGMTFLALFPPLWRMVMDPKVIKYNMLLCQFNEDSGMPAKFTLREN